MTDQAAKPNPTNQASPTRVLVVEDDNFLRKILVMKFEAEGFQVESAADGEAGLHQVVANPPDLMLLDMILPNMNGFEVLAEMKTNKLTSKVPVIVLSNLGQEEDIKRATELGAVDFLVKSNLSIMEVVQKVKEAYARQFKE
jgi:DNA-binding response OmpR family regulator